MTIPQDFIDLFPKLSAEENTPIYWLWVFDPHTDSVILHDHEGRHPVDHLTHRDLAAKVPHPERIHGYAYKIQNGYRIMDWEHRPVDDPHVLKEVERTLKGESKNQTTSRIQARIISNNDN